MRGPKLPEDWLVYVLGNRILTLDELCRREVINLRCERGFEVQIAPY